MTRQSDSFRAPAREGIIMPKSEIQPKAQPDYSPPDSSSDPASLPFDLEDVALGLGGVALFVGLVFTVAATFAAAAGVGVLIFHAVTGS